MLWCGRMGKQAGRPDRPTPPHGLFSREIGERLCLAHRTVAAHLYRIFPKFGVRSRTDLPAALPDSWPSADDQHRLARRMRPGGALERLPAVR